MKEIISHILFFLFCFTGLNSQSSLCGTIFDLQSTKRLLELKNAPFTFNQRDGEITYIPIKFHLVADSDGNGRVRLEDVLDQLCALNINYEPLGFKFYLKNSEVNEINDNTIYSNPASAAGGTKISIEKNESGKNAINIFITDRANTGSDGTTLGYYSPNQDYIVLKKSVLMTDENRKFVLGHEMGHFFGLPHTFNGWDQEPWDGTPVTATHSPGGILNELGDSSNCEFAGDMICDTPADYNLGFGWDGCRDYDGGCKDIKGTLLTPEESNFMGYFIGCNEYFFSEEQSEIMIKDYESGRRSYLRVSYIPNDEAIINSPKLLTPSDNSTTNFYNGVELSWEKTDNASRYLVELTQGFFKYFYTSESNKLFLTDLKEDKSYRWIVRPYSDINVCSAYSEHSTFRTGTMTSSTETLNAEQEVSVFPIPNDGKRLYVNFKTKITDVIEYSIIDASGKVHSSGILNSGESEIDKLNLHPGFYLIKFTQGKAQIFKKIIVNE